MKKSNCVKCGNNIKFTTKSEKNVLCSCGQVNENPDYFPPYEVVETTVTYKDSIEFKTRGVERRIRFPSTLTEEEKELIEKREFAMMKKQVVEQFNIEKGK